MSTIGTPIIVLGMHRSGTSLLAGTLKASGVFMGDDQNLMAAQEEVNAKGFWEHEGIVAIHDEIFKNLGSHWKQIASLPAGWQTDVRIEPFREQIISIIRSEFTGKGVWGLKDPRMCRLLPLWHTIFQKLNVRPKFIIISRHPFEVASSLTKRDTDLSWQYSLYLWLKYTLEAEEYSADYDRSWMTYEALNKDWQRTIIKTGKDLDLQWPLSPDEVEVKSKMKELVTEALWHNHADELVKNQTDDLDCTLDLYGILSDLSNSAENESKELNRIQHIREKISSTDRLLNKSNEPLIREYFQREEIISNFQQENTLLVQQREEFAALNKALREENELLVQQRDESYLRTDELHTRINELHERLHSGLIGLLNRLLK